METSKKITKPERQTIPPDEIQAQQETFSTFTQKFIDAGYITQEEQQNFTQVVYQSLQSQQNGSKTPVYTGTVSITTSIDKDTTVHTDITLLYPVDNKQIGITRMECTNGNITKEISPLHELHLPSVKAVAILLNDAEKRIPEISNICKCDKTTTIKYINSAKGLKRRPRR